MEVLTDGGKESNAASGGDGADISVEVDVIGAEEVDSPRNIVWLLTLPDDEVSTTAPAVLGAILEGSSDTHIMTADGSELTQWLKKTSAPLPECLMGTGPCTNVRAVLMESLGADLLVRGTVTRTGPRWTFDVSLYGADGRAAVQSVYQAGGVPVEGKEQTPEQGLEALMVEAVRALFQATGTVKVTTDPDGATVSIDGREVGVSPVITEVPVGMHGIVATLPNHVTVEVTANVVAGRLTPVQMTLSPRLATLMVDSSPVIADIYIDNVKTGTTGTSIQLAPGEYELELRADGYRNRTVHLVLSPEEMKAMSLQLEAKRPKLPVAGLGDIATEAILSRRYFLRAGYRHASLTTGLDDTQGAFDGADFQLGDLLVGGEPNPEAKADLGYHGVHLEAGYHWSENWGVVAAALTVMASGDNSRGNLMFVGGPFEVKLDDFERVEFKPAQLVFRYPYKNLFPQVQAGFGYFSESCKGEFVAARPDERSLPGTVELERSGFLFHFSIEASYFFDTWWFGHASLGIERDLSHDDTETETIVGLGVGITLENPLQDSGFVEPPREVEP
jgi:hypothetical protein